MKRGQINSITSKYYKSFSIIITLFLIVILITTGPAQAFSSTISSLDGSKIEYGKKITFLAKVDVPNTDKNLQIKSITLSLSGAENVSCRFDITGKKISEEECHGFNIEKIPEPKLNISSDYGYGINGPLSLEYEVTFHTQGHKLGNYSTSLIVNVGGKDFITDGSSITIMEKENGKGKPLKEESRTINNNKITENSNGEKKK